MLYLYSQPARTTNLEAGQQRLPHVWPMDTPWKEQSWEATIIMFHLRHVTPQMSSKTLFHYYPQLSLVQVVYPIFSDYREKLFQPDMKISWLETSLRCRFNFSASWKIKRLVNFTQGGRLGTGLVYCCGVISYSLWIARFAWDHTPTTLHRRRVILIIIYIRLSAFPCYIVWSHRSVAEFEHDSHADRLVQ